MTKQDSQNSTPVSEPLNLLKIPIIDQSIINKAISEKLISESHNLYSCTYCQEYSLASKPSFHTPNTMMTITKHNNSNIKPKTFSHTQIWFNNHTLEVAMDIHTDRGLYTWKWPNELLTKVGVTVADLEWTVAKADLDYQKLEGMLGNLNLLYAQLTSKSEETSEAFKQYQYDAILSVGTFVPNNSGSFSSLSKQLPAMEKIVLCPEDGCKQNNTLWSAVQHLNDHHKWTREAIADWIDLLPFDTSFTSKDPDRA